MASALDRDPGFRFIAGNSALDFLNTVDREGDRLIDDRLATLGDVVAWAEAAGIADADLAARIRRWGSRAPVAGAAAHAEALGLRELLHRTFIGFATGSPDQTALADFDRRLHCLLARRHLTAGRGGPVWRWEPVERDLVEILGPVAIAGAELLTAPAELDRLRCCAGPACGWLYLDHSRNGLRRWCEMRTCGSRAKSRRQYARRKSAR